MADLFAFLSSCSAGDFRAVDALSDDDVKSLAPYVITGWMNGAQTQTDLYVILSDLICNDSIFSLSKHPRLQLKLFVAAVGGLPKTKFSYVKNTGVGATKTIQQVADYYQITTAKAKCDMIAMSQDHITEIVKRVEENQ